MSNEIKDNEAAFIDGVLVTHKDCRLLNSFLTFMFKLELSLPGDISAQEGFTIGQLAARIWTAIEERDANK